MILGVYSITYFWFYFSTLSNIYLIGIGGENMKAKKIVSFCSLFSLVLILSVYYVLSPVTVNNSENTVNFNLSCGNSGEYTGALTGEKTSVTNGRIQVTIPRNSGEIWIPTEFCTESFTSVKAVEIVRTSVPTKKTEEQKMEPVKTQNKVEAEKVIVDWNKPYEDMSIEELQEAILEKMRKNGPVTEYMLGTVRENVWHQSLITWVKSFQ